MSSPYTENQSIAANRWLHQVSSHGDVKVVPLATVGYPGVEETSWRVSLSSGMFRMVAGTNQLTQFYWKIIDAICAANIHDDYDETIGFNYVVIQIKDNNQRFTSSFSKFLAIHGKDFFPSLMRANHSELSGQFEVTVCVANLLCFVSSQKAEEAIRKFSSLYEKDVKQEKVQEELEAEDMDDLRENPHGQLTYYDTKGKLTPISLASHIDMEEISCPGIMVYPFKMELTKKAKDSCKSMDNLKMLYSLLHFLCNEEIKDYEESDSSSSFVFVEVLSEPKLTTEFIRCTTFNKTEFIKNMMDQIKQPVKLEKKVRFTMFIVATKFLGGPILAKKLMNNMRQQFLEEETNTSELHRGKCMIELSSLDMCEDIKEVATPNTAAEWTIILRNDYLRIPLLEAVHSRLYGAIATQLCIKKFPNIDKNAQMRIRCEIRNTERFFRFDLTGPLHSSITERVYVLLAKDIVKPFKSNHFTVRAVLIGPTGLKTTKDAEEYLNAQADKVEKEEMELPKPNISKKDVNGTSGGLTSVKQSDVHLNSQTKPKEQKENVKPVVVEQPTVVNKVKEELKTEQIDVLNELSNLVLGDSYKINNTRTVQSTPKSLTLTFQVEINQKSLTISNNKLLLLAGVCHELMESNGKDLPDRKQKMVTVVMKMSDQSYKAVFPNKEARTVNNMYDQLIKEKLPENVDKFELEVQYRLLK